MKALLTVALDVTINRKSLRKEGIARELVNRIQNLRKDSGFEVTDRIDVVQLQKAGTDSDCNAESDNEAYIKAETLTERIRNCRQSRRWNRGMYF